METPKQKAKELVDKYYFDMYVWVGNGYDVDKILSNETAKRNALIDIQNSIDLLKHIDENEAYNVEYYIKELIEIKTEIEKL
jgi:hypothetical protein